jgi:hypothetical protein
MTTLGVVAVLAFTLVALSHYKSKQTHEKPEESGPLRNLEKSSQGADANAVPFLAVKKVALVNPGLPVEKTVVLVFPDASEVLVSIRQHITTYPPVELTDRLVDMYDDLVRTATDGDASAARILYDHLNYCRGAFQDSASWDDAIRMLRDEGVLIHANRDGAVEELPRGLDTSSIERGMRRQFERCEGVSEDQMDEAEEWARRSAEGNDYFGMQAWNRVLGKSEESLKVLEKAWELGHGSALQSISIYHRTGISESAVDQPDYIKVYAYQLAYNKLKEAAYASQNASMMVKMENVLKGLGGYLTPTEQQQAEEMAREIVASNPNCCIMGHVVPD